MQISIVMCTVSVFEQKYPFWANLVQKDENYQFKYSHKKRKNSLETWVEPAILCDYV